MSRSKDVFKMVEFVEPYAIAGNPAYAPGERHELRDWIADILVKRGIVKLVVVPIIAAEPAD